jgi:hypothetical protein
MNLSVEGHREKLRALILGILRYTDGMTSREISYRLQAFDIWMTPRALTAVLEGDKVLRDRLDVHYQTLGGWTRLTFALKRDLHP